MLVVENPPTFVVLMVERDVVVNDAACVVVIVQKADVVKFVEFRICAEISVLAPKEFMLMSPTPPYFCGARSHAPDGREAE